MQIQTSPCRYKPPHVDTDQGRLILQGLQKQDRLKQERLIVQGLHKQERFIIRGSRKLRTGQSVVDNIKEIWNMSNGYLYDYIWDPAHVDIDLLM